MKSVENSYFTIIAANMHMSAANVSEHAVDALFSALWRIAREAERTDVEQMLNAVQPSSTREKFTLLFVHNNECALFEIARKGVR